MRTRAISHIEELRNAVAALHDAVPGIRRRTGRDFKHYSQRFAAEGSLYVTLEDAAGVVGVALPSLDNRTVVLDTAFVAPGADSPAAHSLLAEAISNAALRLNATRLAAPAGSTLAETYEEIGFAPTLFLQFSGPQSRRRRRAAIDRLGGLPLVELRSHGPDVPQAVFRLRRVDRTLLERCDRDFPGCKGSLFMMNRWIGPAQRPLDAHGSVAFRRPRYVVTHYPRFRGLAMSEARVVDPAARAIHADSARTIVSASTPGCGLASAFQARRPVFVQHLAPVQVRTRLAGEPRDVERIRSAADRLDQLKRHLTFAVQCRRAEHTVSGAHEHAAYTARDVEVQVGSYLEASGYTVDLTMPEQVVSILLSGPHAYLGSSVVEENISRHADEHRRRSAHGSIVSRAQHKLEEAVETFRLTIGPATSALDLGAAPGGWTRVLLAAGATVVAVDPGTLHPTVAAHPRVTHLRCRCEELRFHDRTFGLIVNDMALDPPESAALMCRAAHYLEPDGRAVMTIKLPSRRIRNHIRDARHVLEHAYHVKDVSHLFHNRQEVTAFLVRRPTITDGWQPYFARMPPRRPRAPHR